MEDGDSDAEMADYGTDFSDDVDPNVTRESGIDDRIPRFPVLGGISRFPIPDWPGIVVPGASRRRFPGLAPSLTGSGAPIVDSRVPAGDSTVRCKPPQHSSPAFEIFRACNPTFRAIL